MLKGVLSTILILCSSFLFSQTTVNPSTGNAYLLFGPNANWSQYFQVGGNGRVTSHASIFTTNGNLHLDSKDGSFVTHINYYSGGNTILNGQGGNVGIGTSAPTSKFSIYLSGTTSSYPTATTLGDVIQTIRSGNNGLEIGNAIAENDRKAWILARHSQTATYGKHYSVLHLQPDIGDKTYYKGVAIGYPSSNTLPTGTHLAINGSVGIGTTSPDAKLTVKGKIHAEEVKVDLSVPAPDYVFKEDYKLKTFEEIQKYITENGHLPNIPSAEELEKNGIELGEMNMRLLEKIEELTLYILQQEKQIQQHENELKRKEDNIFWLKKEISTQGKAIEEIKALLKDLKK